MNLPPRSGHIEAQDPSLIRLSRWIYVAWLVWALVSLLVVIFLQILGLALSLFALGGLLLTVIVHLYHRAQVEAFYHYRELEAYFSLFASLKIVHPLPPMRLWRASPDFATQIVMLVRKYRPKLVVEIGSGVSTIITSYCLQERGVGRVISFEHEADFAAVSAAGVADHGLSEWAEVRHAPLKRVMVRGQEFAWYDTVAFDELDGIDLLTVDGPPEGTGAMARYPALPLLYDKLNPGALILVDDFMREAEYAMVTRWLTELNVELVYAEANEKGVAVLRKRG
jgi:predicted O-methyltransferase YrrM